jgi:hypothetical protein
MTTIDGPTLLATMRALSAQGTPAVELIEVYHSLRNGNKDITPDIEFKINEIIHGIDQKERNLKQDVKSWITCADGIFSVSTVIQELGVKDRQGKKNVSDYLVQFCKEGIIEKYETKRGIYRPVEVQCDPIELIDNNTSGLNILYPGQVDKLCKTYPKNIIVVAGEPNAGKTAWLLNAALLNQSLHEVHYFSSEMGQDELVARVKRFGLSLDSWKVKFWDRAGDFHDVIRPDAINIIDFLEMHTDFWRVGALIKNIFDKLNNGIAIIAMQKNPSRKDKDGNMQNYLGLGGYRGAEKARIYLTMGYKEGNHILHIAKGKNWAKPLDNPNKQERIFRLKDGCSFSWGDNWYRVENYD